MLSQTEVQMWSWFLQVSTGIDSDIWDWIFQTFAISWLLLFALFWCPIKQITTFKYQRNLQKLFNVQWINRKDPLILSLFFCLQLFEFQVTQTIQREYSIQFKLYFRLKKVQNEKKKKEKQPCAHLTKRGFGFMTWRLLMILCCPFLYWLLPPETAVILIEGGHLIRLYYRSITDIDTCMMDF